MTLPQKKRSLPSFCRFGQKEGATRHERLKRKRIDNRKVSKTGGAEPLPYKKEAPSKNEGVPINILIKISE